MIQSFANRGSEELFDGLDSKAARRVCPKTLWPVARRKLDQLNQAIRLDDLRAPPANHLEALGGDRRGQHSIRINRQYRICFRWTEAGPAGIEITDYH